MSTRQYETEAKLIRDDLASLRDRLNLLRNTVGYNTTHNIECAEEEEDEAWTFLKKLDKTAYSLGDANMFMEDLFGD